MDLREKPCRLVKSDISGMKENIEPDILVKEAHALLNAAWNTTDEKSYEQLVSWAREIIEPLAESGYPQALWLKCSLPYASELLGELVDELGNGRF